MRGFGWAVAGLLLWSGAARASDVPALVSAQGVLRQNGGGLQSGTFQLTFRIYDASTSGTLLYQEVKSLNLDNGVFTALIGQAPLGEQQLDPAIFKDHRDLWLGVEVENDPGGELPRVRLSTSPYAFQARHADNADQCVAATQAEMSDDANKLGGIPASLYPRSFTSPEPLRLSYLEGTTPRVVDFSPATCSDGLILKRVGGSWACMTDQDTTYTGAGGVTVSGSSVSLTPGGVQSVHIANGAILPAHMSTGSVLADAIATGAVGTDEIADGAILNADVATRTLAGDRLAVGAVGSTEIADGTVAGVDLKPGEITAAHIATNAAIPASKLDPTLALTTAANSFSASQVFNQGFSTGAGGPASFGSTVSVSGTTTLSTTQFNGAATFSTNATFAGAANFTGASVVTFNGSTSAAQLRTSDVRDPSAVSLGVGSGSLPTNALKLAGTGATLVEGTNSVELHPSSAASQFYFPSNNATASYVLQADASARPQWSPLSVTTANIADGTITSADLAANSVKSTQIENGAVDSTKIALDSITADRLSGSTRIPAGKLDINLAAVNVSNTFNSAQTFNGGVTVGNSSATTLSGTLGVTGASTFTGTAQFNSTATFGNAATFNGTTTVANGMTVAGATALNGATTFGSAGSAVFNGPATFNGTFSVPGNASVGGTLSTPTLSSATTLDVKAGALNTRVLSIADTATTLSNATGSVALAAPPTGATSFTFPATTGTASDILQGGAAGATSWKRVYAPQQLAGNGVALGITGTTANVFGTSVLTGVTGSAVLSYSLTATCGASSATVNVEVYKNGVQLTNLARSQTIGVAGSGTLAASELLSGLVATDTLQLNTWATAVNCSANGRSFLLQPTL